MSHTQPPESPPNHTPQALDATSSQAAYGEVTALRQRINQLTAGTTEASSGQSHLPAITLTADQNLTDQNTTSAFVKGFGQNLLHTAIQSPLEGAAQLVDHTIGAPFDSHLYDKTKDLIIAAPAPAAFGTAEWHGQALGGAVGMMPLFLATRSALRSGAGMYSLTEGLVASKMEAAATTKIFSTGGAKLIFEGGATGAAYAGVFKPQDPGTTNYWSSKARTMTEDFSTFATLTASSIYVGTRLQAAALPIAERFPGSAAVVQKSTAILTGALSGIPAAGLETVLQYPQQSANNINNSLDQNDSFLSQLAKNAYTYAAIGGALSAGHMTGAKVEAQAKAADALAPSKPALNPQIEVISFDTSVKPNPFISLGKATDAGPQVFSKDLSHYNTFKSDQSFKGYEISLGGEIVVHQDNDASQIHIARTDDLSKKMATIPDAAQARELFGNRRIGTVPEAFMSGGLTEQGVFQHLDSLAKALRSLDTSLPPQKKSGLGAAELDLPAFQIGLGENQMGVSKIGIGEVAHVYKLTVDGKDFAFKIPNDPGRMDVHGTYAETAAFVHLAKEKVSDLIDFHAANPGLSGGWMLTEYADKAVQRSGRPLAKILADQNLSLGDDWAANRGPGNVAWDLGGIEPSKSTKPTNLTQLEAVLQTKNGQMMAGRNLSKISDTDIKAALLLCLDTPSVSGQVARTAARRLSGGDLAEVLQKALATPGAGGRAAFELDRLAGSKYITPLFYRALLNPEARIEAVKQLDKLPAKDRKAAFDAAFVYPDAREMAARSISAILDPTERDAARTKAAAYPGADFVRLQMLSQDRPLTGEEKATRQSNFERYFERYGLTTGEKIATRGETASFDNWLKQAENSDDLVTESPHVIEKIKEIWKDLNDSQRNMGVKEIVELSSQWRALSPEQWRTMNAAETVQFNQIIERFSLGGARSRTLFDQPTLTDWLNKNRSEVTHKGAHQLLRVWDQFPDQIRALDVNTVKKVADAWERMKPEDWGKLPTEQVRDVAQTISALNIYPLLGKHLAANPDFATWYVKPDNINADSTTALRILDAWPELTVEQKSLSVEQLRPLSDQIHNKALLERHFGAHSLTTEYLSTPALQPQVEKVISWMAAAEVLDGGRMAVDASLMLQTMAKERAPAEQFEPSKLQTKLLKNFHYGDEPQLRAQIDLLPEHSQAELLRFVQRDSYNNKALVKMALAEGYQGTEKQRKDLNGLAELSKSLHLEPADTKYLWQKSAEGLELQPLEYYLTENPILNATTIKMIQERASTAELRPKNMEEVANLSRLPGFNGLELEKLDQLRRDGLSITRLVNYLGDSPGEKATIQALLKAGGDATDLNNSMRLGLYQGTVNLRLVEAIKKGNITAEDVLVKTRDWHSGAQFSELLTTHIINGARLTKSNLADLNVKAIAAADRGPTHRVANLVVDPAIYSTEAGSFRNVLKGIEAQVPADRPIVLLGRDAWPLLPLLRATGRDAHYFLWSRLQSGDDATKRQWIREIPPNAAVIDTGFNGTIIDQIKRIDPGVSGYLMSSSVPRKYPTLMDDPDHSARASRIEDLPKLIYRSSAHTANGGAVARRSAESVDSDYSGSVARSSRWYIERAARDLLRASGLPRWETWRYSQFVGLTPQERLGLSSKSQVVAHYNNVQALRNAQGNAQGNVQ